MVVLDPTMHPPRMGRSSASHEGHDPQDLHEAEFCQQGSAGGRWLLGGNDGQTSMFSAAHLPVSLAAPLQPPYLLLFPLPVLEILGFLSTQPGPSSLLCVCSLSPVVLNAIYTLATLKIGIFCPDLSPLSSIFGHLASHVTALLSCLRSISNIIRPKPSFLFSPNPAPPQVFHLSKWHLHLPGVS